MAIPRHASPSLSSTPTISSSFDAGSRRLWSCWGLGAIEPRALRDQIPLWTCLCEFMVPNLQPVQYWPFTADLYNWKSNHSPFSENPASLMGLMESLMFSHQPMWDDCHSCRFCSLLKRRSGFYSCLELMASPLSSLMRLMLAPSIDLTGITTWQQVGNN